MAEKTADKITVYGIPNCDSVKKAFVWLNSNKLTYQFHDYKKEGIAESKLKKWCKYFGWENVLNKNSTTWKELTDDQRNYVVDEASAIKLMAENTTLIKRPVIEANGKYLIRFNEQQYADTLLKM